MAPTLQTKLLAWAETTRRDLPWRATRDPWRVLVSEVMSQQTQVARVVPKYKAFIDRFPTAAACAEAEPAEVITLWAGLGYNRRALALHRCAQQVVTEYAGKLPTQLDDLLCLPGIGPYTARAVMAFAAEADVGVVDTNVGRVLARWNNTTYDAKAVQEVADAQVRPGTGWAWNQAMLDFGATICTKRSPQCGCCPVSSHCQWRGRGEDPAVGSAAVSGGQSRFVGSDRQGRGRLIEALRTGPVAETRLAEVMGWPDDPERAKRVAATLDRDGLIQRSNGKIQLPSGDQG